MPNEASKQSRSPRRELAPRFPVHCDEKKPGSRGRERSWVLGLGMGTQGRTFSSKDCARITRPSHPQPQRWAGIGRRLCMQTSVVPVGRPVGRSGRADQTRPLTVLQTDGATRLFPRRRRSGICGPPHGPSLQPAPDSSTYHVINHHTFRYSDLPNLLRSDTLLSRTLGDGYRH